MKIGPCKNCEKRTPGCHGNCVAYAEWTAEKRKEARFTAMNDHALDTRWNYGGRHPR